MTEQGNFAISVVLRHERDGWAAQCLEYDIAAQGHSLAEANSALERAFVGQIVIDLVNGKVPLEDVPPAPEEYWQDFKTAERMEGRKPFYIPPAYMVRASVTDTRIAA
jgi:hypothetical protein